MTEQLTDKQLIEKSRVLIDELRREFVEHLAPIERTTITTLLRIFEVWKQVNLRRIVDLADAALDMFLQDRLVPACTLTRSVFETVGIQYYIHKKIVSHTAESDPDSTHDLLLSAVFGRRDKEWPETSIQVLTAIDHMNTEFKGSRAEYDRLCEYAHPNMMGGFGTYVRQDGQYLESHFGRNPLGLEMGTWGLGSLHIILILGTEINNRLRTFHPEFIAMAEKNACNYPL